MINVRLRISEKLGNLRSKDKMNYRSELFLKTELEMLHIESKISSYIAGLKSSGHSFLPIT